MSIVFDLLLVAVILFCGWQGYRRGLLAGIMAILFIVVSLYGANLLANAYSYEFVEMFQPFVSGYVDARQAEAVEAVVPAEQQDLSVEDLIKVDSRMETTLANQVFLELGIHESKTDIFTEQLLDYRDDNQTTFNRALVAVISQLFCFLLVFVIAFVLILILFTVISNIIHLSFKLPGLKLVDDIGGGLLGVGQGVMLCLMLAWLLGFLGMLLPDGLINNTHILKFFVSHNLVTSFLGL